VPRGKVGNHSSCGAAMREFCWGFITGERRIVTIRWGWEERSWKERWDDSLRCCSWNWSINRSSSTERNQQFKLLNEWSNRCSRVRCVKW
jgi:hypothetical protein